MQAHSQDFEKGGGGGGVTYLDGGSVGKQPHSTHGGRRCVKARKLRELLYHFERLRTVEGLYASTNPPTCTYLQQRIPSCTLSSTS